MLKLQTCIVISILVSGSFAHAFLSTITDTAKEAGQAAAVVGATTELLDEVTDSSETALAANKMIQEGNETLQKNVREAKYLDSEAKALYQGPDHTSRQLTNNIQNTTQFIKRAKRLLLRVGLLSPATSTAVNTAETNVQLTEMQRNQQTQTLIAKEHLDYVKKRDERDERQWSNFIQEQRAVRGAQGKK